MKRIPLFISWFLVLFAGSGFARTISDPKDVLFQVTTNAYPTLICDLKTIADFQNVLLSADYVCNNAAESRHFSVDQLRVGVVLKRDEPRKIDVVSVVAPTIDAIHGGTITVHYLFNGLTGEYKDWNFEAVNQGNSWLAYTSRENGFTPFNKMFMERKVLFGQMVGIKSIVVKWARADES
jgi:hypothetical protein